MLLNLKIYQIRKMMLIIFKIKIFIYEYKGKKTLIYIFEYFIGKFIIILFKII